MLEDGSVAPEGLSATAPDGSGVHPRDAGMVPISTPLYAEVQVYFYMYLHSQ
jgi:hypothetical protein